TPPCGNAVSCIPPVSPFLSEEGEADIRVAIRAASGDTGTLCSFPGSGEAVCPFADGGGMLQWRCRETGIGNSFWTYRFVLADAVGLFVYSPLLAQHAPSYPVPHPLDLAVDCVDDARHAFEALARQFR